MRRIVAPAFALLVLVGVLFGFATLEAVGRLVSRAPAAPPWQSFALAGLLGGLAVVLVAGTLAETVRARCRRR